MRFSDLPVVWGQTTGSGNPSAFALLALRRWYASLTLSSPDAVPSLFGLSIFAAGLAGLLVVVLIAQGPGRFLAQFFDLRGHLRLLAAASARLRGAGRVLAATIGLTVLAWTASQTFSYNREQGKADLVLLLKSRGLVPLAMEQGALATLTPLRDVAGLADNLPLLVIAGILVFRAAADRMSGLEMPHEISAKTGNAGWDNVLWISASLYLIDRAIALGSSTAGLPPAGCLILEVVLVPAVMLLCDAMVLAWMLAELRGAGLAADGGEGIDPAPATALMPAATLACLAALPARYLATGVFLLSQHLPPSYSATAAAQSIRWQLNWGLAEVQGLGLVGLGVAGAVAWSRGTIDSALRGYARMLRAQGGRLLAVGAAAGLASGGLSALAYSIVLSLPPSTWVLAAADGYAHYATLPVGLLTLAALVELGERSLPEATAAGDAPVES